MREEDDRFPVRRFVLLLAVGLIARLTFVMVMPRQILWPDGREYVAVARSLLAGLGYGLQTVRPPGYPTFIAAVWAVTGPSLIALRVVEALIGTASVGLAGLCGLRWFGRWAGLTAMALAACHPVLAFLPSTEYSENVLVFVCIAAYAAAFEAVRRPRGGWGLWAVAGTLFGIAALIRPNAAVLVPGLLIGAGVALRRAPRVFMGSALVCTVMMALVIGPWLVRNHRVQGHWYFIATGGGHSLWLGSNDQTTGHAGSITDPDSSFDAELMRLPDAVTRDRLFATRAFEWMAADPKRALRMYGVRMASLWALYPDTYTHNRFTNDFARWAQGIASAIIMMGALLALVRGRAAPLLAPMSATILLFSLVNAMFFMTFRYRMPLEPLLLWMAGIGWCGLPSTSPASGLLHGAGFGSLGAPSLQA